MSPNKKAFLKHALTYGSGVVLLQAASVVLIPLYTNYLPPSEFGAMDVLQRIGNVFTILLMTGGVRLAAITFYCQAVDERERERTASTVIVAVLAILAFSAALLLPLAGPVSPLLGLDRPSLFVLAVGTTLLEVLPMIPMALMQARVESFAYVACNLGMFFVRVALVSVALVVFDLGLWGIFGATGLTSLLFGVALTVRELRRGALRPDWGRVVEVIRFSLPFVPGGILMFLMHSGDRFFLLEYADLAALGVYALGYRLATATASLAFGPLMAVWNARVHSEIKRPDASVHVGRMTTRILAVFLFASLGVAIFAEEIVTILGTSQYVGAGATIAVILLACFFQYWSHLMDLVFYVFRRTGLKPWITLGSTAVTMLLFAWLIRDYGVHGAAWAKVVGFACHAALTLLIAQRVYRVRYEFSRIGAMLGLAVVLALCARWFEVTPAGIAAKACLLLIWPAALWITGLFRDEEKDFVVGTIQSAWEYIPRRRRAIPRVPVAENELQETESLASVKS